MLSFFCYFLAILWANQPLITCLITVMEEPVFSQFFVWFCHPAHLVLSLLGSQSYLGCCYLKAELFFFFPSGSVSGSLFILDSAFLSYNN